MLISAAWQALQDAGVDVVPADSQHVELHHSGYQVRVTLHPSARPMKPSDVLKLVGRHREPGLLVVPSATTAVRRHVERAGWSWVVSSPTGVRGVLRLGQHVVPVGEEAEAADETRLRPGPVPWGGLTVMRRLLFRPPATQTQLADLAWVTQPRVSQTLKLLTERAVVRRTPAGWAVQDVDALIQQWLDTYPGPRGIATYWYGLDPPLEQAKAVVSLLADGGSTAVSGDVAADLIAPWRVPVRAVIYARTGADLAAAGLSTAGPEEATLELILPEDPGVWPDVPVQRQDLPVADVLQVLWDVRRAQGPDSGEAVERLRQYIVGEHDRIVHSAQS